MAKRTPYHNPFHIGATVRAISAPFMGGNEYKEGDIGIVDSIKDGGLIIAKMGGPRIKATNGQDLVCDPQNWETL